jgi:hypothetical protein
MVAVTGYHVAVHKLAGPGDVTFSFLITCADRPGWSEGAGFPFRSHDDALRAGLRAVQDIIKRDDLTPVPEFEPDPQARSREPIGLLHARRSVEPTVFTGGVAIGTNRELLAEPL